MPQPLNDPGHLVKYEQGVGTSYYAVVAGVRMAKLTVGLSSNLDHLVYRYELPFTGKVKVLPAKDLSEAMFKLSSMIESSILDLTSALQAKKDYDDQNQF